MKKCYHYEMLLILFAALIMLFSWKIARAHEWMAPKEAATQQNPISATAESVKHGNELFQNNCAYCHGDNATGLSADEVGLEKSPPDLIQRLNNHTDGDFFWKIQHGRGEMPGFKDTLEDDDIWHIINFIKSS